VRIPACDLSAFDAAERVRHSARRDERRARRHEAREVAESGRMRSAGRVLAAAIAAVTLFATPVAAEHEIYYRFTVLGYIKDTHGKPVTDAKVEVTRDKTDFKYLGETDDTGFYIVRVRLGDESRGETLTVRQGAHVRRVIANFDPSNVTDERGTRVDFEGAHSIERAARFQSTLQGAIGAVSGH
jgi:hypothetical protein